MATTPQYFQIDEETPHSTPIFRPTAARRTPSFSSSSPSNSWDSSLESPPFFLTEDSPPFIPSPPPKFKGIPFSWEQTPGIPKNHRRVEQKEPSGHHILPLPPASKKPHNEEEISPKRHQAGTRLERDPFFAALVECSKDDHVHDGDHGTNLWKGNFKITKSVSDRFGFINMYITSCKRTCAVSESIVYLPRGRPHYLLHRRRH